VLSRGNLIIGEVIQNMHVGRLSLGLTSFYNPWDKAVPLCLPVVSFHRKEGPLQKLASKAWEKGEPNTTEQRVFISHICQGTIHEQRDFLQSCGFRCHGLTSLHFLFKFITHHHKEDCASRPAGGVSL